MSIKMMFAAMNVKTGSPITKLVLVKLADNANDKGECWPSHETIADICEMSVKTSQRHVNKLEEMGLISKERRKTKTGNTSNLYTLNYDENLKCISPKAQATISPTPSDLESSGGSVTESPESVSSFNQSIKPVRQKANPPTPFDSIVAFYNEVLCNQQEDLRLKRAVLVTVDRKKALTKLWELLNFDLAKIEKYINWLWDERQSHTWLFGNNSRGWSANLEYVCREETVRKATENDLSDWEDVA